MMVTATQQTITPTHHQKMEWARMAQDACRQRLNAIGTTFSVAASMAAEQEISIHRYDELMDQYREWLTSGFSTTVDQKGE